MASYENHQGKLSVSTIAGKGTTFSIELVALLDKLTKLNILEQVAVQVDSLLSNQ